MAVVVSRTTHETDSKSNGRADFRKGRHDLDTGKTSAAHDVPGFYLKSDPKSGLRKAIEGRLRWLGFETEFDFLNTEDCPDI